MTARHATRRGFTLVELMVATAIGLFVVAALYNLFTGQVRQLVYQDLQMEMHQNARLAVDIVSRTSRLAGLGTNGTTTGLFGAGGDQDQALPAIVSYNGLGPNGSDAITLVSMDPALQMNTTATSPPACTASTLEFNPAVLNNATKLAQFKSGELLLCYDYAAIEGFKSYLWRLTADGDAVTGAVTLDTTSSLATDFAASCPGSANLPLVMSCSRAEVVTFYIDADDTDGVGAGSAEHPVLMMDLDFESPDADDVPVVDNVEDFQIAYCLQSATGATDCSDATAWQDTINPDQAGDVYMIRIGVVVRSSREDLARLHPGQRPALEDNPASTTTDNYFRQILSTEVEVRNMRIQANL